MVLQLQQQGFEAVPLCGWHNTSEGVKGSRSLAHLREESIQAVHLLPLLHKGVVLHRSTGDVS